MVVEDNDMLLAALRRALVRAGYEMIAAETVQKMTKLLDGAKPDLMCSTSRRPTLMGAICWRA